jgi:dipeptidyl aminopeptidase/acylaminoacyl peptidase
LVGGVLLIVTGLLGMGWRAAHIMRAKAWWVHPHRGNVVLPASLGALGGRRDVAFEACGGVVRGWYFQSKNRAAIVMAHGSGVDRSQLAPEVQALVSDGFGVLAFDLPGHGESAGRVTYGTCDRAALKGAVSYAAAQPDVDPARIGAYGLSVGAAIVAMTAAEDPRFRALVLVSPFTDSDEQARAEMQSQGAFSQWVTVEVDRYYLPESPLRPIDAVRSLTGRATMVVATEDDPVVPRAMSERVYEATAGQKELCVLPAGGHANVEAVATGACADRVADFLQRHLNM